MRTKGLSSQGIAGATVINALGRIFSSLLKLLVIVVIAKDFGAALTVDAYMVAKSVPFLFIMIGEATLVSSFLPIFLDLKVKRGEGAAWLLADSVFTFVLLFLSAMMVCVMVFAPTIAKALAPGLPAETVSLGASLLRMMAPVIVLTGICSMGVCVFNSYQHFSIPAMASVLFPLGMVLSIVLLGNLVGVMAIPVGALVGIVAQTAVLLVALAKEKRSFRLSLDFRSAGFIETVRSILPRLVAFVVNRLNMMVDRIFASALGGGFISALSYADRIVQISVILFTNSLIRAAMPVLCKLNAMEDMEALRSKFGKMIGMLFFFTVPASVLFVLFGRLIVSFLLQRGAFDVEALELTTQALVFYGVGLLPFSLVIVLSIFFYAANDSVTPMKAALVCFVLNTLLDFVLVRFLEHGGLALATSLVALAGSGLLLRSLHKKMGPFDMRTIVTSFTKIFLAAVVMGGVVWAFLGFPKGTVLEGNGWIQVVFAVCVGFASYLVACHFLKVDEQALIFSKLSGKLHFGKG